MHEGTFNGSTNNGMSGKHAGGWKRIPLDLYCLRWLAFGNG
jgi:hypothetical protein